MSTTRNGYAVAIQRSDGSEFLCAAGSGILPAVWTLSQRKRAVECKQDMISHGFKARVVRVTFTDPQIAEKEANRG